jgi:hypothetical protein
VAKRQLQLISCWQFSKHKQHRNQQSCEGPGCCTRNECSFIGTTACCPLGNVVSSLTPDSTPVSTLPPPHHPTFPHAHIAQQTHCSSRFSTVELWSFCRVFSLCRTLPLAVSPSPTVVADFPSGGGQDIPLSIRFCLRRLILFGF